MTNTYSSNLFKIVSKNYNNVKSLIDDGINLANECISVRDDFEDLNTALLIISGFCILLTIALIIILVLITYNTTRHAKLYSRIIFMIVPALSVGMSIAILVCYLNDHNGDMKKLKSNFDNIKGGTGYTLISNCKNDSEYFKNKETFNCLNVKLMKHLKHYYESGFSEDHYDIQSQKIDGTSDIAIFLGGIENIKGMKTTCEKLIHRWFYIITPLFILLAIEFTSLLICFIADRQVESFWHEANNLDMDWKGIAQKRAEMHNYMDNNWKFKYFLYKLYNFWDILGGIKRGKL